MLKLATTIIFSATVAYSISIFDDDHDFMKGFETGIMMRNKENKLEELGCVVPDTVRPTYQGVFDTI